MLSLEAQKKLIFLSASPKCYREFGSKTPCFEHRLWIKIEMVEIPKVGGCEAAFSRHPRT